MTGHFSAVEMLAQLREAFPLVYPSGVGRCWGAHRQPWCGCSHAGAPRMTGVDLLRVGLGLAMLFWCLSSLCTLVRRQNVFAAFGVSPRCVPPCCGRPCHASGAAPSMACPCAVVVDADDADQCPTCRSVVRIVAETTPKEGKPS